MGIFFGICTYCVSNIYNPNLGFNHHTSVITVSCNSKVGQISTANHHFCGINMEVS